MIIVQRHNNNMSPMDSNHGDNENLLESSTVENNPFQMPPLSISTLIGAIYTIHLKYGIIIPFKTIFHSFGKAGPDSTCIYFLFCG